MIVLIIKVSLLEDNKGTGNFLGHVFEYSLDEFALAEDRKGGQFNTPRNVVMLLAEMLETYEGLVLELCYGSGGMFVHSGKFFKQHQGNANYVSICEEESNLASGNVEFGHSWDG